MSGTWNQADIQWLLEHKLELEVVEGFVRPINPPAANQAPVSRPLS